MDSIKQISIDIVTDTKHVIIELPARAELLGAHLATVVENLADAARVALAEEGLSSLHGGSQHAGASPAPAQRPAAELEPPSAPGEGEK